MREHGLQAEPDEVILEFARVHGFVVVSEDTDFGDVLARQRVSAPVVSLVLLRTNGRLRRGTITPNVHDLNAQFTMSVPVVLGASFWQVVHCTIHSTTEPSSAGRIMRPRATLEDLCRSGR